MGTALIGTTFTAKGVDLRIADYRDGEYELHSTHGGVFFSTEEQLSRFL